MDYHADIMGMSWIIEKIAMDRDNLHDIPIIIIHWGPSAPQAVAVAPHGQYVGLEVQMLSPMSVM